MPANPKWFDDLSQEDKLATIRAGYKPAGTAPPGPGELRAIERKDHLTGRLITEYEGDCDVWMNQFKPPVRQQVVAFRGNSSAEEWATRQQINHEKIAAARK